MLPTFNNKNNPEALHRSIENILANSFFTDKSEYR